MRLYEWYPQEISYKSAWDEDSIPIYALAKESDDIIIPKSTLTLYFP